jgi:hypothetical protein
MGNFSWKRFKIIVQSYRRGAFHAEQEMIEYGTKYLLVA